MSRLPAVRLGSLHKEDPSFHEIEVDFHEPSPGNKFGFAWPSGSSPDPSRSDHPPKHDPYHEHRSVNIVATSEETDSTPTNSQDETTASASAQQSESRLAAPSLPRLSRAFSMPLPSQIGHYQHPVRTPGSGTPPTPVVDGATSLGVQQFQELSLSLADSVQMAIQTLLQLSPPQLFDSAKEQLSSCAVQIPTASISALLTSMKNLNYISANMERLGSPAHDDPSSPRAAKDTPSPKDEFDVGELLQSVGDSLGGIAAEAAVDLVLHHGDAGIKHIGVKGDECGISYALSHIIHQVITTTRHGDTIEVGLSITGQPSSTARDGTDPLTPSDSSASTSSMSSTSSDSPVLDDEGPVVCTFDIAHRFFSSSVDAPSPNDPNEEPPPEDTDHETSDADIRPEPQFETTILRRLLRHIGGTLRPSLQPRLFNKGRRCELAVTLERGPPISSLQPRSPLAEEEMARQPFPNVRLAHEPTLEELTSFAETLRGKKVAFHASSQGSFAHHLTRYLTAWGMDISHVPTDGAEEKDPAEDVPIVRAESVFSTSAGSSPGLGLGLPTGEVVPIIESASDSPEENKPSSGETGLSFIIIDDDVNALRRRLLQHRAASVPNLQLHPRKRPSLAANHRPRSSPSIRNTLLTAGAHHQSSPPNAFSPVPIVHFTSLANYKLVKDAIQAVLISSPGPPTLLPEVIVIPKPAGPRRLLTALHTAVLRPIVDPFFSPIATSPMSPSGSVSPFMTGRKSAGGTTPPLSRSETGRSSRSPREAAQDSVGGALPPSSPLAMPDGLEYFSDAAVKKLGGNAASGLVIQSPDGRPAGIFFQPQSRMPSSRSDLSSVTMEREKGTPASGSQRSSRRGSTRKASSGSAVSPVEPSNSGTPTPSTKPSLDPPSNIPSPSSPSRPNERPRLGEQTEFLRSYKGKGRASISTPAQDESRALSSAAWREATQNLAKQIPSPSSPASANTELPSNKNNSQSPTTDTTPMPSRKGSQTGIPAPMSRSSSSPPSPEARKTIARRTTQGPKSPVVSTGMKKSKTMGNNIVPPISVLIVEDNAINQTILSTFMRRNKIKYEVAWNGREAVEKWRHGNFHLILMDIQMPVMDGIEATKEIRRLEKLETPGHFPPSPGESSRRSLDTPDSRPSSASSTPFRSQVIIVALTASSLQSDRVAALAAGCNDFLTKPVTNSWLNDKVIEWGSIKALQMWAELRPEVARNISHDQAAQALAVANKLHVPPASTRKSPLNDSGHLPLSAIGEGSRETTDVESPPEPSGTSKPVRRSSDKRSSSSDSSPERWPVSSDEEDPQDPITEPPAVIRTPVHETIELPVIDPAPHPVTGEAALLNFLEESKHEDIARPALLGRRARSSVSTSTSIASVMHDTPGVGGTATDGLAAAGAVRDTGPFKTPEGDKHPAGH